MLEKINAYTDAIDIRPYPLIIQ